MSAPVGTPAIILVDDDPEVLRLLRLIITSLATGYTIRACTQGDVAVKGFHLTNKRRPDTAKHPTMACQGVVQHRRRPDANALQGVAHSVGAFTIRVAASLLRSTAACRRAKV